MHSITANPADIVTGPLEKHFPVSSGTDHREKEDVRGPEADLPVYEEPTSTSSEVQYFHTLKKIIIFLGLTNGVYIRRWLLSKIIQMKINFFVNIFLKDFAD